MRNFDSGNNFHSIFSVSTVMAHFDWHNLGGRSFGLGHRCGFEREINSIKQWRNVCESRNRAIHHICTPYIHASLPIFCPLYQWVQFSCHHRVPLQNVYSCIVLTAFNGLTWHDTPTSHKCIVLCWSLIKQVPHSSLSMSFVFISCLFNTYKYVTFLVSENVMLIFVISV